MTATHPVPPNVVALVTPARRVLRSVIQLLASLIPTIPLVFAGLPSDLSDTAFAAWAIGIFGGAYLLLVSIQNWIEARPGVTPLLAERVPIDAVSRAA